MSEEKTWHQRALDLKPQSKIFIHGNYVDAVSGKTFEDIAPHDDRLIAHVASGDAADIDLAVQSSKKVFDAGSWREMNPRDKKAIMLRWASLMEKNKEELALLEAVDTGKPIGDALSVDIPNATRVISWSGEAIDKTYEEIAPAPRNALAMITREPLGVIGAVVPLNYPMMIASWKLAPAIAMGNSVVVKPAENSSLSTLRLAQLAIEAGLPPGVFNVVPGLGPQAGQALARHMDVAKIAFTGSPAVGRKMLGYAAESNMKQVALELGGKSAQIILNDCVDLKAAASAVAWAIYYNAGQTCSAGSRIIVEKGVKDELFAHLREFLSSFLVGSQFDPTTQMAGLVSKAQRDRVNSYLDLVGKDGEEIIFGGQKSQGSDLLIAPTLIDKVKATSRLAQEEIFGPVLVSIDAHNADEAIAIANGTDYSLAASIWTSNLAKAHTLARRLRAGTVWVNTFDMVDVITPVGGFGLSGSGRDKSLHALDTYSALKTTWIDLN